MDLAFSGAAAYPGHRGKEAGLVVARLGGLYIGWVTGVSGGDAPRGVHGELIPGLTSL